MQVGCGAYRSDADISGTTIPRMPRDAEEQIMPRPLRRAAVLGTTAHAAKKRGEARGTAIAAPAPTRAGTTPAATSPDAAQRRTATAS